MSRRQRILKRLWNCYGRVMKLNYSYNMIRFRLDSKWVEFFWFFFFQIRILLCVQAPTKTWSFSMSEFIFPTLCFKRRKIFFLAFLLVCAEYIAMKLHSLLVRNAAFNFAMIKDQFVFVILKRISNWVVSGDKNMFEQCFCASYNAVDSFSRRHSYSIKQSFPNNPVKHTSRYLSDVYIIYCIAMVVRLITT